MNVHPKQLAAVVALPSKKRYEHFIKVVADTQLVWGLYNDGWVLGAANDDGTVVLMVWPEKDYAEICLAEWPGCQPKSLHLDELMSDLLPKLAKDKILPGIFFVPAGRGITPTVEQFTRDLEEELRRY